MIERPMTQSNSEGVENREILTYEQFRYKPGESDAKLCQPFNNFYFYFYTGDNVKMSPIDVYLEKTWFKKFTEENPNLLKDTQEAMSKALGTTSNKAKMLENVSKQLHTAYLVATRYTTDKKLFS